MFLFTYSIFHFTFARFCFTYSIFHFTFTMFYFTYFHIFDLKSIGYQPYK